MTPTISRHWRLGLSLVAALALLARGACFAGSLDDVRGEVREEHSSSSSGGSAGGGGSRGWDGHCNDDYGVFAQLFVYTVLAPFALPRIGLDDTGGESWFLRYPFDDAVGHMSIDNPCRDSLKLWSMRVSGEYASDLNDVDRLGGKMLFSMPWRIGIDTQTNYLHERLPAGASDDLWTGDFNVVYRFAQADWAEFRAGVGMNWFADRFGDRYGFNTTYGWDVTVLRPIVWSTELDLGSLGDAFMFHGRTTLGVVYRHVELFVGYDYTSFETAHIHGLVSGLRLWF